MTTVMMAHRARLSLSRGMTIVPAIDDAFDSLLSILLRLYCRQLLSFQWRFFAVAVGRGSNDMCVESCAFFVLCS